jgi:hypothetical protein
MGRAKPHLVWKHLERISARIFEQYREIIPAEVHRENGVYALYKDDRLYYVGLAKNLKSRLNAHLRDRHKGKWNVFSVYLTTGTDHMRELEALVLRIAHPAGNTVKGKLKGSADLGRTLKRQLKSYHDRQIDSIFGRIPMQDENGSSGLDADLRRVAHRVGLPLRLRAVYKGVTYKGKLRRDGSVSHNGDVYPSLSAAGKAVRKRRTNGWAFWHCERGRGSWVRLSQLRR